MTSQYLRDEQRIYQSRGKITKSKKKKKEKKNRSHDKSQSTLFPQICWTTASIESIENTSPSFQEHLHSHLAKTRKEDFKADYWRPLKTTNIDQPEGDSVSTQGSRLVD